MALARQPVQNRRKQPEVQQQADRYHGTAAARNALAIASAAQRTQRWRSSLRDLQTMAQAAYAAGPWDDVEGAAPDPDANDPLAIEDALLTDGPEDDADEIAKGEPEADELLAFELLLREDHNAESLRDTPLTLQLADWHVLRVTSGEGRLTASPPECRFIPKAWMRQLTSTDPSDDFGLFLCELSATFDQIARSIEQRLPTFLATPDPTALMTDWRRLQHSLQADLPGKNLGMMVPTEQVGFIELVFHDVSALGDSDSSRRARFSDVIEHSLLYWRDTGCFMPLRQWFDNPDWKRQVALACAA